MKNIGLTNVRFCNVSAPDHISAKKENPLSYLAIKWIVKVKSMAYVLKKRSLDEDPKKKEI